MRFVVVIIVSYILYSFFWKKISKATGIGKAIQSFWHFLGYCEDPGQSPNRELALWIVPWYFKYQLNEIDENLYPNHTAQMIAFRDKFHARATQILETLNESRKIDNDKLIDEWNVKTATYNECRKVQAMEKQAGAVSSSVLVLVNSTATHLGPWLALIVMILTVILLAVFISMSSRSGSNKKSHAKGVHSYIPKSLVKFTKLLALKHSEDGESRPSSGGRCGNEWIADAEGNSRSCLNTISPADIKTKFYEHDSPVYIPWLVQDTFFVPQCESSYIIDKAGNKQPTEKKYYIDGGLTCTPTPN